MDISKRFDRILQLFFILQSKSLVTIDELEERFSISRRTIFRDLKSLEEAGVPVGYEPGRGYSLMEGYRIQPSRFTHEEVLSLLVAEKIMQQHETQYIKSHYESALIKIKSSFQVQQKNTLVEFGNKLHISTKSNSSEYLPNVINILLSSTVNKILAIISYIKGSDSLPSSRCVEPVGLFYESGFWYVLAFCQLRNDYRNFRLDRIKKVSLSQESFSMVHPPLDEIRSIDSSKKNTRIVIKVDRKFAHYLFWERQNFGYLSEESSESEVTMHFDCAEHPTSFVRWFMKFVDHGEILEPAYLQDEVAAILLAGLTKMKG